LSSSPLNPRYLDIMDSLLKFNDIMDEQVKGQRERTIKRATMNQWLDENENEWALFDKMCRSRPWATNVDKPFPYPFKEATREMRDAGEALWIGDTEESLEEEGRRSTRREAPNDVLTNIVPVKEYPPLTRVLLFTPEFGSSEAYADGAWGELQPRGSVDVWTVTWQGWTNFEDMIIEVYRLVETFADGVSTVWFGHSMGAIVMYECLKKMHTRQAPCLPVAVFASGCPAPHLFGTAYRPQEAHPWLANLKIPYDFNKITAEQTETLRSDFSIPIEHVLEDEVETQIYYGIQPPQYAVDKVALTLPRLTRKQATAFMTDRQLLNTYSCSYQGADRPILVPLVVFRSDCDELVPEESVDAWKEYTTASFEVVALEDLEDSELLSPMGHGFARRPPQALLKKVSEVAKAYCIKKDINDPSMLPDIGPTNGPLPESIDVVIVGAGITGICSAREFVKQGFSVVLLDKTQAVGGIWRHYANIYSRVNTSEVGYRIIDQEGPTARPNQDHSPTHDIMRDIHTVLAKHAYGCARCGWEVVKTEKQADDTWVVTAKGVQGQGEHKIHCKFVLFAVNRRIGKRRDVVFKDETNFRGDICYGYANELTHLKFWGKRVIIVGAGAFAFENLRTALEHGAKHVTILGRRSGSTCPKWIDMIAFMRPTDEHYNTNRGGNMISFEAWRKCYEDAGLDPPECWEEGLLKPHNHTVSVSDLVFVAGFHGMTNLKVGEIDRFRSDGHGVILKDGSQMDVDIVIKCTGFHLNEQVPKITGKSHMYPSSLVDFNMAYIAEPLLDGGQFGSSKGKEDSEELKKTGVDEILQRHQDKLVHLPKRIQDQFVMRGNPFGSGYAGGLLTQGAFTAWLAANPDKQRDVLEGGGEPRMDIVKYWASFSGIGKVEELKELLALACES